MPSAGPACNTGIMRPAFVAPLLCAAACGFRQVQGPPGEEQIVVQGVLSPQASEQVLWIERTIPAGDPIVVALRPLATPPTRVEVRDTSGAVFSYQPDTTNPARFVATFTPVHGQRYDLVVEAGSHVIRGSTTVPAPLTILDPAADTVPRPAPADSGLRLSWASGSSPWVLIYVTRPRDTVLYFPLMLVRRDTSALLPYFFISSYDSTLIVSVLAVDSVTARVFNPDRGFSSNPAFEGNLTGGPGLFGATTSDRFVVRVQ